MPAPKDQLPSDLMINNFILEEENRVSVWIGKLDNQEQFNEYISAVYDDDGEMTSQFMCDFAIEHYDMQFQEALFVTTGSKAEIFKDFSYIETFLDKIPARDVQGSNCFILLYNYSYTGTNKKARTFNYAGTFGYR